MTEKGVEKMNELIMEIALVCENDEDPYCFDCPLWVEHKCAHRNILSGKSLR